MNTEVDKLDMNKLVNARISLNSLKTKEDDLDVGKLKIVPVDLEKLRYVIESEIVKNKKIQHTKEKSK